MPASVQTASCIWNSFRSSGKRHLILTGSRGIGKTTLLHALAPEGLPGVTTWVQRGQGVFLKENAAGETVQIGRVAPEGMRPDPDALNGFGAAALARAGQAPGEWVSVDEVGYLETGSPAYCDALRALLDQKRVLAVVRRQNLPLLQELCRRPDVFCLDLDQPLGQLGCVVMASGLGRRFGGNKLLAGLEGKPLVQYALDATGGLFARRVVVTRHADVADLCRAQGVPVVLHSQPHRSDTVRLGLEALNAGSGLDGCLFCPGDQPLLTRETVLSLALCGACAPGPIWRAAWQEKPGAPVLFPAWAFEDLMHLPQGKGGGAVIQRYPDRVRLVPARSPQELADVDRPEDLEMLRALGKGRPEPDPI